MSDSTRRFFARQMFALQVHTAKGCAYEELFKAVMQRRYDEFVPMRPYGNVGDRKNDGYIPSQGMFFQLYAPLSPDEKLAAAAKKAEDNFEGLKKHWQSTHPIRIYRFVFNDEYRGSVEPLEKALTGIARAHSIDARSFLAKDLEGEFIILPFELMQDVLQTIIPESGLIADADYYAVREVVEHVLNMGVLAIPPGKLIAPEFDEKIHFNGLTAPFADLLRAAAYQVDVVEDYFSKRGGNYRQDLRNHLAAVYTEQRDLVSQLLGSADETFVAVMKALTPPSARMKAAVQNAVLVIMAYYFEACDIFEIPNATT